MAVENFVVVSVVAVDVRKVVVSILVEVDVVLVSLLVVVDVTILTVVVVEVDAKVEVKVDEVTMVFAPVDVSVFVVNFDIVVVDVTSAGVTSTLRVNC